VKTPEELLTQLDTVRLEIRGAAARIRDAEQKADEADRVYRREFATVYRRSQGSIRDREQQALLECQEFARHRDDTAAVVAYLKTQRGDLELEQSNLQSQGRLLDGIYRGAGPQ
jgi:hypothetical protein